MRRCLLAVLAAVGSLLAFLAVAGPANAAVPGSTAGGGGMFAILGLPSLGDIIKKVANGIWGAMANSLMPDFVKESPGAIFAWLTTITNPAAHQDTAIYGLMDTMRVAAFAFLGVILMVGVMRGSLSSGSDHPIVVLGRTVGVAGFLAAYPWLSYQAIGLFNTLTKWLLTLSYVKDGMNRLTSPLGLEAMVALGPFVAVLVIVVVILMAGLLFLKVMLMYLVPLFFVALPLVSPLAVLRETAHIPKTVASLLLAACAIPAGWCLLFAVAGAMSHDMLAMNAGNALDGILAPMSLIGVFGLSLWLPFSVLSFAKGIPGRFSVSTGAGPVQRAGGAALKLSMVTRVAAGGAAGLVPAGAGAGGGGGAGKSRLAADDAPRGRQSRGTRSGRGGAHNDPASASGPQRPGSTGGASRAEPRQRSRAGAQEPDTSSAPVGAHDRASASDDPARQSKSTLPVPIGQQPSPDWDAVHANAARDQLRPGSPPAGGSSAGARGGDAALPPSGTTQPVKAASASSGGSDAPPAPRQPRRPGRKRPTPSPPPSSPDPGTSGRDAFGGASASSGRPSAAERPSGDALGNPSPRPASTSPSSSAAAREDVQTPSPAERPSTSDLQAPVDHDPLPPSA